MAISLAKQQTISLDKTAGTGLQQVRMGLGWDPEQPKGLLDRLLGGGKIDLDASCILLDASRQPVDLVWFRQLESKDGSVTHSGDNRTGEGSGDDEVIQVNLERLPSHVSYLVFTVNSFTGQTFEMVANAYCRIMDQQNRELARFALSEKGPHTGVIMASLSRSAEGWNFTAIGKLSRGNTVESLLGEAGEAVAAS